MLKDTDLMPFGEHKGKALANVPDAYLKWAHSLNLSKYPGLREYIEENFNVKVKK